MSSDEQDLAVARHVKQAGLASPEQIARGVEEQGRALQNGEEIPLAEALVRTGILTPALRTNIETRRGQHQLVWTGPDYPLHRLLRIPSART